MDLLVEGAGAGLAALPDIDVGQGAVRLAKREVHDEAGKGLVAEPLLDPRIDLRADRHVLDVCVHRSPFVRTGFG